MDDYTLNWPATLIISIIAIAISLYIIRLLGYSREVVVSYYNKMLSWAIFLIISVVIVTISFYAVRLFHYLRNVYVTWKLVLIISVAISFLALCLLRYMRKKKDANGNLSNKKKVKVVIILGGPGSGKSTQCAKIGKYFGYTHLSSGDLLRSEADSGSRHSSMIKKVMKEGKLVPSKFTVDLILRAMRESENNKFLLDGFPRDVDSQVTFQNITKIVPEFVLFLDCPEEELYKRLSQRNQGREDDNNESIKKRIRVFKESTLPVIKHFNSLGRKVYKIDGAKSPEKVFEDVKRVFLEHGDKVASF